MTAPCGGRRHPSDSHKRGRRLHAVRRLDFAAALACFLGSPLAAAAQIPDIVALPHDLRTMSPGALSRLLFGTEAPPFTDAWVQGPTREYRSITVDLATTPVETGFDGLCTVRTASTAFGWNSELLSENARVRIESDPAVRRKFVLTSDTARLEPTTSSSGCATLKPLSRQIIAPTILSVWDRGSTGFEEASVTTARFALTTMIASRAAAAKLRVKAERCVSGIVDVPSSCGDPAAFARTYYLRQIVGLVVDRCDDEKTMCVDASITDLHGRDVDHVVVTTGLRSLPSDPHTAIPIVAIAVRAGSDSVD